MDRIDELRQNIDDIDNQLLMLLNKRAEYVIAIGNEKHKEGKPLYVPSREKKIYDRLTKLNPGPFPDYGIRSVFREIISASLSLEEVQKIGYLGPEGTFTNLAGIKHFGLSAKLVPMRNIPDVFEAVEKKRLEFGIIPIENSLEGVVNHALDMFMDSTLNIVGEIFLEVSQNLMTVTGRMDGVTKIYSHPHAIAQCKGWLHKNAPDLQIIEVESTARAAEIAKNDPTAAAIGSEMAEIHYNLRTVERRIEDGANNFTRFLIVGNMETQPTGKDKTSIMFSVANSAGSLYSALEIFSRAGVNMTKIESRPSKRKAWEYVFYVDLDGHRTDAGIDTALRTFEANVSLFRILGSYPKGEK